MSPPPEGSGGRDRSEHNRANGGGMLDLPLHGEGPAAAGTPDVARPRPSQLASTRAAVRRRLPVALLAWLVPSLAAVVVIAYLLLRPTPARPDFTPSPFEFAEQRVGLESESQTLTVANTGERPLAITGVTLTGPAAEDFAVLTEDCSTSTLQAGETCGIGLGFAPSEMGQREAVLELHAAIRSSPARAPVTGVGVAPLLGVQPGHLRFPAQEVTVASAPLAVTLTNEGTAPLTVNAAKIGGAGASDFRRQADRCAKSTLDPGASCGLQVVFVPRAAGIRSAEISFDSDALDTAPVVSLSGEGLWTGGAFAVEPRLIDFGRQLVGAQPERRAVQVTNRQGGALRGLRIELADPETAFAVASETCTDRSLAAGESCRIDVTFAARREGAFASLLQIGHADSGVLGVELAGQGVAPRWVLNKSALIMPPTRVASASERQIISLDNRGSAAGQISKVELAGPGKDAFSLASKRCTGRDLQPGERCQVEVEFRPAREGAHRAQLVFLLAAGQELERIELEGVAVAPRLTLDREVIDFGDVNRTTVQVQELRLSNRGTTELRIAAISVGGRGDFRLLGGTCFAGIELPPGEDCSVKVGFSPSTEDRLTERLRIDHDGISGPREVPLGGVGIPPPVPRISMSTLSFDFGPRPVGERSPIFTLTVQSLGTGRLELRDFTVTGPQGGDFYVVPATCQAAPSLLPGSDCSIGLRFVPSEPGDRRARLIIHHNAGEGLTTVELAGRGLGSSP